MRNPIPVRVEYQMLIRKPAEVAFKGFAHPEITTQFWFSKSNEPLEAGKTLRWEWEMYGAGTRVHVKHILPNKSIALLWGDPQTTVEFKFQPLSGDTTYVVIKNDGFQLTRDRLIEAIKNNTGGFTTVLMD